MGVNYGGLLKDNCKCCNRPLKDIISRLKGIGPICDEMPRCSECHKPVKKQAGGHWLFWGQHGIRSDNDGKPNPVNGIYLWAWSYCCHAEIENVQIIYDAYRNLSKSGEEIEGIAGWWNAGIGKWHEGYTTHRVQAKYHREI